MIEKSTLVDYVRLSPNHSGKRTMAIDRITPHCTAGLSTVQGLGSHFFKTENQVSANYGIGVDGQIGLYVNEDNRSWCSSSNANDQRAVTIECASKAYSPYEMPDIVYSSLIDLCVDICQRNGKTKLLWFADKDKTLYYVPHTNEMVITVHRWFSDKGKSCPGDWLYSRLGDLAKTVTERLTQNEPVIYRVQLGAYRNKDNAKKKLAELEKAGFSGFITEVK